MSSPIGDKLGKETRPDTEVHPPRWPDPPELAPVEVRQAPPPAASRPQQGIVITLTGGGLDAHHVTSLDGGQTWRLT